MTLARKTALIVVLSILAVVLVLIAVQRLVVMRSFADLERDDMAQRTQQAVNLIQNEVRHLAVMVEDWAAWDDTYRFAQDGNQEYEDANLQDDTLVSNGTNVLMILNAAGQVVFSRQLDLLTRDTLEIPELGQERMSPENPLLRHASPEDSVAGVLLVAQGPLLIASNPIVTSLGQGPIEGTLIMARLVDADLTRQLAETMGETWALYRFDDPELPVDVARARESLAGGALSYAQPLDARTVAGYAVLEDINATPALLVRIERPRSSYQHGEESFRVLMATVAGTTVVLSFLALLVWYRMVFTRLNSLAAGVRDVAQSADLSQRVATSGGDEVSALAGRINSMLSGLERAEQVRERNRSYVQAVAEAAQLLLNPGPEIPYEPFLKLLAEAAGASRVYVQMVVRGEGDEVYVSERAEWHADAQPFEAGSPRFQNFPVLASGFQRWLLTMRQGQVISGVVADFPPEERAVLEAEGITAILALPLTDDGVLTGFIGFDQRGTSHAWDPALVDLLRAAAADLSQALKRQTAEGELRRLKEFNEGIVRGVGDGLVMEDATGAMTFVNPAVQRLLGYTEAELLGAHWRLIVPPEELEHVQGQTDRRRSGEAGQYETRLRHKDGHEIPVLVSAQPLFQAGKFAGALTAFADITARVRAEAETQAWKQRYDLIVASSGQMVYDYDTSDGSIVWGGGTEHVLGMTPEELSGGLKQWEELRHPEDRPRALALRLEAEKWAAQYDAEYRMRHKDGSYRWVHDRGFFLSQAVGRPSRLLGMVQDISARKRAEEERDELEQQLREAQKLQSIGMLAGGVAHDFNNLLTVILGNTELALERAEPSSALRHELESVHKTAKRAAALTQQLLAFGRRQILQPRILDLNALVSDFGGMLGRLIGEHIQLHVELAPELGSVYADSAALTQVLMGLALNARDAMPPEKGGGELRITTQQVALDSAFADTHPGTKPGPYVQLAVTDTGEGMDAATMQHLFEPFFTTKELGKGTGLGLAAAYGIIRQHNGWIDVHSQPGRGTRFDIYLPVQELEVQSGPAPRSRKALGGQETILVAEDEDGVRELACGVLQSLGYRVVAASDGREALRLFEADPPRFDLALLDAMMPQLTGVKAYEAMLAIRPDLPVLFVSGYSAEMVGVPPSGPHLRLLQKPFTGTELASAVRETLGEV